MSFFFQDSPSITLIFLFNLESAAVANFLPFTVDQINLSFKIGISRCCNSWPPDPLSEGATKTRLSTYRSVLVWKGGVSLVLYLDDKEIGSYKAKRLQKASKKVSQLMVRESNWKFGTTYKLFKGIEFYPWFSYLVLIHQQHLHITIFGCVTWHKFAIPQSHSSTWVSQFLSCIHGHQNKYRKSK